MLRDPIELYEYPKEWCNSDSFEKVRSGLYILTPDGWLRRGITTATTASAAVNAAIASLYEDVNEVDVVTPVGITLKVKVNAEDGTAFARKFAGDHAFDVTDGLTVKAVAKNNNIKFGKGVGFVSKAAMEQIMTNFNLCRENYNYRGGVLIEVPDGELIAKKTRNPIPGGISILGTTGFVEPWCKKLVETKIKIAKQYNRIAVTTGRIGWRYALENFRDYQPFVFGVHITEILKNFDGEIIIVGLPKLLFKWAGANNREAVFRKARELNKNVVDVVLL
uniref:Cobalt-precorrin-5B (C(1))-methyltransferase n=1 Tax=Geoglobus ahangari TaxID=113653 RepID=A0A7C4W363_9EURY